jgi:hypothetical protein
MSKGSLPIRQFQSEAVLRTTAVEIARFACDGDNGRVLGDPVFEMVTEGRAKYKGYSACGDLAHYLLAQLGVRDESLVNRDSDGGEAPWKMGVNLSRVVYQSGKAFVWAKPGIRPKPGDILYVSSPEHVCILEHLDENAQAISVFEYGQWDSKRQKPSGKRRQTKFSADARTMKVGTRYLRGWLDIARIPGLLQQASQNSATGRIV